MLYDFTPYSANKDLAQAYNDCMRILQNDDDWAILRDSDTMWLTTGYYNQIKNIINKHPDTGIFTCVTNRIGNRRQLYAEIMNPDSDIVNHKKRAEKLYQTKYEETELINGPISGFVMVIKKSTWNKIKFTEYKNRINILGVDTKFSRDVISKGYNIRIMKGVYVFHYYRMVQGINDKKHIQ
jgi:GT2 family glycosyltransferase